MTLSQTENHSSPQNSQQHEKKKNRLTPSRFGNCQKQIAPHGNSSIHTRAMTRRGFIPSGVSLCFGLAVTLRRIKCCFVAAVSCPSPCSPLCILCTVQHVEGEIKVKAASTGSRSGGGGTLHAKDHTAHKHVHPHADRLSGIPHPHAHRCSQKNTLTRISVHAGVPFVLSVFRHDG